MSKQLTNVILLAIIGLASVTFISPTIEASQDKIVVDTAITRTCYERHGFNFLSRWPCRSVLQQAGPVGLSAGCAFDTTTDFCRNFWNVKGPALATWAK